MENLDLKSLSSLNRDLVKSAVSDLKSEWIEPHLNVILIWNNDSAILYSNTKRKIWETLWIKVTIDSFSDGIDQWSIKNLLLEKNYNSDIHWIMIESPIPNWLYYDELIDVISPFKDVDWLHTQNLWMILTRNNSWILPATPLACISILEKIFHDLKWIKITLVWHWKTVWWPLSNMLSNMWATVTTCNHYTKDLKSECLWADVIITATWVSWLIRDDMVDKNTIIIDAWISLNSSGKIVWDVDYENVSKKVRYVTPVPGWVWPITTSIIFQNLIKWIIIQKEKYNPFSISLDNFISISKWPWMPWWWWISAITAINSISMISMVYSLTKWIDKNIYETEVVEIIEELKKYYNEDINAFKWYLSSIKLPKNTNDEVIYRTSNIQKYLKEACIVPIKISELCLKILIIAKKCYEIGNKNVLSDVRVWVNLAISAAKSALEPIDWNLSSIKDEEFKKVIENRKKYILSMINNFNL